MGKIEEFPVIDLDRWVRGERDTVGNLPKRWFHPHAGDTGWLFKPRIVKTETLSAAAQVAGDPPRVVVQGQDWAEKIAAEVAGELGIPAVMTELATASRLDDGLRQRGSISRDMRPRDWECAPGAQLLAERDDDFNSATSVGHTLSAIRRVLSGAGGPPNGPFESWDAFDVFAGYLLYDAWIGNTDRHAHNWAVLEKPAASDRVSHLHLAPAYDHGRAFGSGLSESDRAGRVASGTVDAWCARGVTSRFDGARKQGLVTVAINAMSVASVPAQRHWNHCLQGVELETCNAVVAATPGLSDTVRSFVMTVLTTNRRRLIDALY